MSPCGEVAVSIASRPSVRPPMYCAAANLSTDDLERCQLRLGGFHCCRVGGVLCVGGLLHCQLVVQIQLGRMHGLGGLLGLPRQLIELCQRIVCGIGLHMARDNASENH